jgi:hypothetical protein
MAASHAILRFLLGCCFVVAFLLLPVTAPAEILKMQYTGLNISYDGTLITTVGGLDELESVDYFVGAVKVLSLDAPGDSPLAINLSIPGVTGLPVGGGTATSATGGTLSLTLPGGDFLNLELGAVEVVYVAFDSVQLYFTLAAGSAEVLGQSLPVGGLTGDVAVSFSSQVAAGSLKNDGKVMTGFLASGTGEIEGTMIPEPTGAALLIGGLVVCLAGIRRRS